MKKIFFLLALIATLSFSPVFAQQVTGQQITVNTDNTAYQQGDIITITGNVEKILPGTPIVLQVFFERTQVAVDQITVSNNGKFSTTLVADGKLWSKDGQATLRIGYGGDVAETSFDFFKQIKYYRVIKILGYKINLLINITIKDLATSNQILSENFNSSLSYKVQSQHSETIKLENESVENLVNKIYQDFLIKLSENIL